MKTLQTPRISTKGEQANVPSGAWAGGKGSGPRRLLFLLLLGGLAGGEVGATSPSGAAHSVSGVRSNTGDLPILIVSDPQLHELRSGPVKGRRRFDDIFVPVAIRPVPQDVFADELFEQVLASAPARQLTLFGGDLADVACKSELQRGFAILNEAGPWFGAPGNHDAYFQGNLRRSPINSDWDTACRGSSPLDKNELIVAYLSNLRHQCEIAGQACDNGVREFIESGALSDPELVSQRPNSPLQHCNNPCRCGGPIDLPYFANDGGRLQPFICDVHSKRGEVLDEQLLADPDRGPNKNLWYKEFRSTRLPHCDPKLPRFKGVAANAGVFLAKDPAAVLRSVVWYLNRKVPENSFLLQVLQIEAGHPKRPVFVLLSDSSNPSRAADDYIRGVFSPGNLSHTLTGKRGATLFKAMQYELLALSLVGFGSRDRTDSWIMFQHHDYKKLSPPSKKDVLYLKPAVLISAHTHKGFVRSISGNTVEVNVASTTDWVSAEEPPSIAIWDVNTPNPAHRDAFSRVSLTTMENLDNCSERLVEMSSTLPDPLGYKSPPVGWTAKSMFRRIASQIQMELGAWQRSSLVPDSIRAVLAPEQSEKSGDSRTAAELALDRKDSIKALVPREDWLVYRRLAACRALLAGKAEKSG
jgi:hypothetical protein